MTRVHTNQFRSNRARLSQIGQPRPVVRPDEAETEADMREADLRNGEPDAIEPRPRTDRSEQAP